MLQTPLFGELLRRHRLEAGLTQEALAERAGLSLRAISDLERGLRRAPYRETVRMLSEALGLDLGARERLESAARRPRSGPTSRQPRDGSEAIRPATPPPPSGTVTLLFTDIESSTALLRRLGEGYAAVLADHHRLIRQAIARHHGLEVDTAGDAFFVAFARASDAVHAASMVQRALAAYR